MLKKNESHNMASLKLQLSKAELPTFSDNTTPFSTIDIPIQTYDLTLTSDSASKSIYYITDLHLEFQLQDLIKRNRADYNAISAALDEKISEMIGNKAHFMDYLLIGGDVGHSKELVELFYQKLSKAWSGRIISVLGNHELWDDHPEDSHISALKGYTPRPLQEVVDDYAQRIHDFPRMTMLQNGLYAFGMNWQRHFFQSIYLNGISPEESKNWQYICLEDIYLKEEEILDKSEEGLRELLSKCPLIVLGGIGFSGLNPHYNAELGIYRSAITTLDEDEALSEQFRRVYDKINRCAGDRQVIVLTHMPVRDWCDEPYNPNWIYINGHTHHNKLIRKKDGTTVLADNQVGYAPQKWKLNKVTVNGWYDPFQNLEDAAYKITLESYIEFCRGRGINITGCNHPGTILMLKRNSIYMFLLKTDCRLYVLNGGKPKRADHDEAYYYDNMERYVQIIKAGLTPYQNAMKAISKEIQHFGGYGEIHGCIVNIDDYNHISLNPIDGKITPYYAKDTSSQQVFPDLLSLLEKHAPELAIKFKEALQNNMLPILDKYAMQAKTESLAIIPEPIYEINNSSSYRVSRIMRSIQYVFENNVIRSWHDVVLNADYNNQAPILPLEDHSSL